MKLLGIDFGEKRIGLSIADDKTKIAFPFKTIYHKNNKQTLEEIKLILDNEGITDIVIGIPLSFSFQETQESKKIQEFISKLKEKFQNRNIHEENELLTSKEAENLLGIKKNKQGLIDAVAAALILQTFLDKHK
jgi:putative Holliday junction resolvase